MPRLAGVLAERAQQLPPGGVVVHDHGLARLDSEQLQEVAGRAAGFRQSLRGGLLPLVGDHHQPVAAHDHGLLERHDLLAADVRRRDVVAQDEPPAAEGGVEHAPGHDAVGRAGAGELADRADVEAAGTAAHRFGDQAHVRPRDPHEAPVQGVDGAACVAARRREGGDPGRTVVRRAAPAWPRRGLPARRAWPRCAAPVAAPPRPRSGPAATRRARRGRPRRRRGRRLRRGGRSELCVTARPYGHCTAAPVSAPVARMRRRSAAAEDVAAPAGVELAPAHAQRAAERLVHARPQRARLRPPPGRTTAACPRPSARRRSRRARRRPGSRDCTASASPPSHTSVSANDSGSGHSWSPVATSSRSDALAGRPSAACAIPSTSSAGGSSSSPNHCTVYAWASSCPSTPSMETPQIAEPRTHHADVVGGPVLLSHAQRRMGEEDQPGRRGAHAESIAHAGRGAVDGDHDGGARVDAEAGEPRPRPRGRGHHLLGAPARPPVAEHDEPGALQHERTVQRHQVPAPQVLRRLVGEHDGAVGEVHEPEVADDGDPVRRPGVAELPGPPHPVDPVLVARRDVEGERAPRQPREGVVDLAQGHPRLEGLRRVAVGGEPVQEAFAVAVEQGGRGVRQLETGQAQRPLLVGPCVVIRLPHPGRNRPPARHSAATARTAQAKLMLRRAAGTRPPGAGREAPVILSPDAVRP